MTPLPSNLVEVETLEAWKTEFKNEISSLRINGEGKIHRAMEELRKMQRPWPLNHFDHLLLCTALGIVYSLDYLLRFNADKIDNVIDLNLNAINKSKEGMIKIPLVAISFLEKHPNKMHWDENNSVWTFLDMGRGIIRNDLGLFWNYWPRVLRLWTK